MGGEKKMLYKPVENLLEFLVLFPSFNAYETAHEFKTSCEKPVPSQSSLHFHCFVGGFTTMQDVNHNNNRGVYRRTPLSLILV